MNIKEQIDKLVTVGDTHIFVENLDGKTLIKLEKVLLEAEKYIGVTMRDKYLLLTITQEIEHRIVGEGQ